MGEPIKYMSIKEFQEGGFLMEVNRQVLHPLGLALEVNEDDDGEARLSGVWDYRDDPEGMVFGEPPPLCTMEERARPVVEQLAALAPVRLERFGWVVQPWDEFPAPAADDG